MPATIAVYSLFTWKIRMERCMDPDDLTVDKKKITFTSCFGWRAELGRTRDPSFGKTNDDDVDFG